MRSGFSLFIALAIFILLTDGILWLLIRNDLKYRWIKATYWILTAIFLAVALIYQFIIPNMSGPELYVKLTTSIGIFVAWYIPKFIYIIFRVILIPLTLIGSRTRRVVKSATLAFALLLFLSCIYGFTIGRYSYKIHRRDVAFKEIPEDLRGLKIVHFSDLHLGSVKANYKGYEKLVEEINRQNPDLILFTGDMVNNFSEEVLPFASTLRKLKARYGVYSIVGNHDYGGYTKWGSPDEKAANFRKLIENEHYAGFTLLLNENVKIPIGRDTLLLAGVENWSNPPFPQTGDINKALIGRDSLFTIVLSHDPTHWRAQLLEHNVDLSLSGHTHAMQMGVAIGKHEWSPAKYFYLEYDGLYREGYHYLNVSRGVGYIGIPGRIGLRPSFEVLTLTKDER